MSYYVAEVVRRTYQGQAPPRIHGPDDVADLTPVMRLIHAKREHFLVLLLNARHELQGVETVSLGSLNASIVHPREVFLPAVRESACAIILVHNHPSGDPEPSEDDRGITDRVRQAGELLGITVLDHVIVAARGLASLRNLGLGGFSNG